MNPLDQTTTETRIAERINTSAVQTIATNSNGGLAFNDASQMMEFAKMMAVAQVAVPKHLRNSPGACLAVCIQASEWQMSPFSVANKSYSVNDRLAYEAQLINAVILKRAPIRGRFKIDYIGDGAKRKCKVSATLTDGEVVEYESPEIGTIKVKNSPLWQSDPDQQLFYFSSRSMCRRHFPDVLLGVYTPDDIQEMEPRDVTPPSVTESKLFKTLAATSPQTSAPPLSVHEDSVAGATLFEVEAVSLVDQVQARLTQHGLKWSDVLGKLQKSGIGGEEFHALESADEDTLKGALSLWASIVKALSGKEAK